MAGPIIGAQANSCLGILLCIWFILQCFDSAAIDLACGYKVTNHTIKLTFSYGFFPSYVLQGYSLLQTIWRIQCNTIGPGLADPQQPWNLCVVQGALVIEGRI